MKIELLAPLASPYGAGATAWTHTHFLHIQRLSALASCNNNRQHKVKAVKHPALSPVWHLSIEAACLAVPYSRRDRHHRGQHNLSCSTLRCWQCPWARHGASAEERSDPCPASACEGHLALMRSHAAVAAELERARSGLIALSISCESGLAGLGPRLSDAQPAPRALGTDRMLDPYLYGQALVHTV